MKITTLHLHPQAPFDFQITAYSHGWIALLPNIWDDDKKTFQRTEKLTGGQVVHINISGSESWQQPEIKLDIQHQNDLSPEDNQEILKKIRCMLRLNEDLSEFYALCRKKGPQWQKVTQGAGRLLRSPTLFEDIIKTICTTNIQWGGTKRMVNGLVEHLGAAFPGKPSLKAFPTADVIANSPPETFTEIVRFGYRGPYIHQLGRQVASGELDLDTFLQKDIPTPEIKKRLLAIKGIGNYAAATLLMILDRYDELAVDTVFREFVRKKYFNGEKVSDEKTCQVYQDWGQWKYLAYWFDIWQGLDETI
ncbi:MAG: hypothetical protein JEZ06_19670 [Anaerolineaceae bacterium]|nr:hypothetical protein [Anaerolineaceae bacterium]